MAHILIMPRQGNSVESCIIVAWKVEEGAKVSADSIVCDVETDKATFEVPAGAEGTILKLLQAEGADVPVLEPIAVIGEAGEDWRAALGLTGTEPPVEQPVEQTAEQLAELPSQPTSQVLGDGTSPKVAAASPRAKKLAAKVALDHSRLSGSGPGGRIIEQDVQRAAEARPAFTAAAAALVRAASHQPAESLAGSGLGGRIKAADLSPTGFDSAKLEITGSSQAGPEAADSYVDTPLKGIRKLIGERMQASLSGSAQFTLNASADAERLLALRARFKSYPEASGLTRLTINDLLLFLVSRLLPQYPFMNAHRLDDRLRTYKSVNLGLAVDTPRGLMVPVIRQADRLSLVELSAESKRLSAACQNGQVTADELTGSSFTVTNLGMFGVENFTPIINLPEIAILGIGSIELRAQRQGPDGLLYGQRLGLSLTIDHQAVDGAPAARFLQAYCQALSDIDLWLAK